MPVKGERGYRPIRDYALIGDTHTGALVARDGSIDWCCLPHFDSPAIFCRILDASRGGYFRVGPVEVFSSTRRYVGDTNVLATTFETADGEVRLTDLMAVEPHPERRQGVGAYPTHDLFRLIEGVSGEVEVEVVLLPTPDYARAQAKSTPRPGGAVVEWDGASLVLGYPGELRPAADGALAGRLLVRAGDRHWVTLAYHESRGPAAQALEPRHAKAALVRTLDYWRRWSAACSYQGDYASLVRRSALVLKLLTFSPTGAIVAAPTTSLPEEIGGVRNWDYRFTWLRDSSLILYALQSVGYRAEADDFFDWLERLCLQCHEKLQIMYTVHGGEEMPERTLDHLEGYRASRPVRIGNAAAAQRQLDVYGEVLDAAHLHLESEHLPVDPGEWRVFRFLANRAAQLWREPDQGIWEVRGGPRHFLYSKLMCWVALDRAVRLAETRGLAGELELWRRTREEVRRAILDQGYDQKLGAFTQAFGEPVLDASALAIPLVGFLPATDPRVRLTVERVRERLTSSGLVYRYHTRNAGDGLPGGEATFALCSFWLVDNLALGGRQEEARELFERVVSYANDVGLLSEEIDPTTGQLLGNYPQGFTHLGLIRAVLNIAKAEAYGAEEHPETQTERQPKAAVAGREQRPKRLRRRTDRTG